LNPLFPTSSPSSPSTLSHSLLPSLPPPLTPSYSRPESKQLIDLATAEKGDEEDEEKTLLLSPDEYESPQENSAKAELQVSFSCFSLPIQSFPIFEDPFFLRFPIS